MKNIVVMSHAGVLSVNRALFQELARITDIQITLIVPKQWNGDLIQKLEFQQTKEDHLLKIIAVPVKISGNGSLFFYSSELASELKKLSTSLTPDFLFLDEEPWSLAALQAYQLFKNTPKCFFTKQNLKKKIPLPFRLLEQWVFKNTVFAFTISEEASSVLRSKKFTQPIHILPHSYEPTQFHPLSPNEKQELKLRLGIPYDNKNSQIISYFGRMTEEKGILDLLKAFELISHHSSMDHTHFLWVGSGPLYPFLKASLEKVAPTRATLLPAIEHHEVGKALALSDVVIVPSRTRTNWKEQFGRILIEAMACGAAVIGSDSGEIPHLINKTQGGLVFPEGNAFALADKMIQLATNPSELKKYQESGKTYVEKHYSHKHVATTIASYLRLSLTK